MDDGTDGCTDDSAVTLEAHNTPGCFVSAGEWNLTMNVHANPDHQYNPRREWALQPQVYEGGGQNDFWAGIFLPRALVSEV